MKKKWLKNEDCTGCGMCANICPKQAISMVEDNCGFIYPSISCDCINCDACETACRKRMEIYRDNFIKPITYAAWSFDEEIRFRSTSGGAFSELAITVLNKCGTVVGAEYNGSDRVRHCIIERKEELDRIRQSKYIQSESGFIYSEVRNLLKKNKMVLFCGTPCQVLALYTYLGKEYDNLVTIDFICRGVNSPKAFRAWISEIERDYLANVKRVWFKYKENGWKQSPRCTRVDFVNGNKVIFNSSENLFMNGYLASNLYIRPSCGNCICKSLPRKADITLADFWGVEKDYDDDSGTSLILINSKKGLNLLNQTSGRLSYFERPFSIVSKHNPSLYESVKINTNSRRFLNSLDRLGFSKAMKKYSNPTSLRNNGMRISVLKSTLKRIIS